jgi:hypothetical protein
VRSCCHTAGKALNYPLIAHRLVNTHIVISRHIAFPFIFLSKIEGSMKVVYATFLVFVLWLIAATSYCNTSHCVLSHTLWNGNANCFHENATSHNLKSKSKTSYLYPSPYWNVSYLNKTCTHLKHFITNF